MIENVRATISCEECDKGDKSWLTINTIGLDDGLGLVEEALRLGIHVDSKDGESSELVTTFVIHASELIEALSRVRIAAEEEIQ